MNTIEKELLKHYKNLIETKQYNEISNFAGTLKKSYILKRIAHIERKGF